MAHSFALGDDGANGCIRIGQTALPCPGVALRLSAVIDCTPCEHRMPPITIDFLKTPPPQHGAAAAAAQVAGRFTCSTSDFVGFSQPQWVAEIVAAAGLPPECAPIVNDFLFLSAASAANSFYKAMAVTVEAGDPGSFAVDVGVGVGVDEDEVVPPGADAGECAICYGEYLVGGATSVTTPCGHTFHRRCLDRWTAVKRSCPYCRAPVPGEYEYWYNYEEEEDGGDDDYYYYYRAEEHDDGGDLYPGEDDRSGTRRDPDRG